MVRLGKQHARNGWFKFTTHKGRNRNPVIVELPIVPALQKIIDATPTGDHLTFLTTAFGRPFTANGFGNKTRQWCDEAGLPHCPSHGLRKAAAATAAESSASVNQLMAIFGWLTEKEAIRYTKAARRKKLAGAATKLLGRHRTRTNLSHLGAQFLSHRTQVTACIARFLAVVPRGGNEPPTP